MKTPRTRTQSGFSLIEILVAVFVVSIGMLGVARMEILAKESNIEATQRTIATQLAHDIIAKMRANPTQLASYANKTVGNSAIAKPGTLCDTSSCTDAQLATWDLYAWEQSLMGAGETTNAGATLTGGLDTPRGCITGPAAGGPGEYVVTISWKGKSPLKNNPAIACGTGLYGANDVYRRVLNLTLFISDDGV